MLNPTKIAESYSRLFPMVTFKEEDWALRKIVIDLCCEGILDFNETDNLLNSFKFYKML